MASFGKIFSQNYHVVPLLYPIADALAGTVTTDIIDMSNAKSCTFYVMLGARTGTTADTVLSVEACDDTSASNTSAIAFKSRRCAATDVWSALTNRTSSGFTTTTADSQMYAVEVDEDMLAASGYRYVRLKSVEATNDPQVGAIFAVLDMDTPRAIQATQVP
jgi:1,2-phenylacetyl-CoA epoxidase PaaB subunit